MTERDIFTAARAKTDAAERAAYLDAACAGEPALRARVERLLHADEQPDSVLDVPAVGVPGAETEAETPSGGDGGDADNALAFLKPPTRPGSLGRLGHYEVLEVLGRGGFGVVFRAFDEVLQRVVAVKVLAPQMAATSPARKRFLREARSSAQVRHENVVHVYAVEESPLPYLVMEFIPGETLQQRLDRTGPLDVPDVLRIGRQIAEGLAAAHATGLIHRDVKPANVLIEAGPQERVKLTDFGLARAADDASISQSGVVAGTPMYMAPEQARGESLDHRADLFSLGSVLYVMCTGRPPFRASGTMAVLKRVCEEDPRPIREVIPEVPEWLCRVVEKLHAKDPDRRFQTAREVADVLAECERQLQAHGALRDFSCIPGGGPRRRVGRRRWKWAAAAAVVLPLLAWAGWSLTRPDTPVPPRNPFGLPDVRDPDGADVQALAAGANLPGGRDDPNAEQWVDRVTAGDPSSLDGEWSCRWREPGHARWSYTTSPVQVRTVGDRVFFLYADADGRILLETRRVGSRLVGREWKVDKNESFPCALEVLSPERLDGTYGGGSRFDFRRSLGAPPEEGWVQLFNGKDLAGWTPRGVWTVQDGILTSTQSANRSELYTDRDDFTDFHLRVEARVNDGGNSGIFFRYPSDKVWRPDVLEAQIHGTGGDPVKTGSLFHLGPEAAVKEVLHRPDEWFTLDVIAAGDDITVRVNGRVTTRWTDPVRTYAKGRLAVQVSRDTRVQFRKVEVKELPPGPDGPGPEPGPPSAENPLSSDPRGGHNSTIALPRTSPPSRVRLCTHAPASPC